MITQQRRIHLKSHPPSSENLCAKEMMSEARPLPSQTTTGIGGSSLRLSRAMEITLGPPSTIRQTRGTPWPNPGNHEKQIVLREIPPFITKDDRTFSTDLWEQNTAAKHGTVMRKQGKTRWGRNWRQRWQLSIPLLSLPYPSSRHRMTKGSPQVTEISIHMSNKTLLHVMW